jgi:cell division protein FtsI (penicillin-binding protein 3)
MKIRRTEAYSSARQFRARGYFVVALFAATASALIARDFYLQILDTEILQKKGVNATTRIVPIVARRGTIYDRNGEPMAVSEPVDTLVLDVAEMHKAGFDDSLPVLAQALHLDPSALESRATANLENHHLILKLRMDPDDAARITAMHFPGLIAERAYKRYYPAGEVTGHLLGMTDFNDRGQEGLEFGFESILAGEDGLKRVLMDGKGRAVAQAESRHPMRPGQDLYTSIDLRIQYLAYRELKSAVQEFGAKAGSVIVVDARTGEVLAEAVQPMFNPNDREHAGNNYRNTAMLDTLEPGSTFKSFWVAAGLETGKLKTDTIIDTGAGFIKVADKVFKDEHPIGKASLAVALAKSSNVALAHIGLMLNRESVYTLLTNLGFGKVSETQYPAEAGGRLAHFSKWKDIDVAVMSHGTHVSVTPFQLASAYTTIAAGGVRRPLTFRRLDGPPPAGTQVMSERTARELTHMLESVVTEGTAKKAQVRGYTIAGKTGTVFKVVNGVYTSKNRALFAGMVPARDPRLVALVVIDEPTTRLHQGGDVAAPVFSGIMTGALRLLSVRPDEQAPVSTQLVQVEDVQ